MVLNTVEVRKEQRGRGWVGRIICAVEEHANETMWSSGNYTELGHRALAAHLPLLPGCTAQVSERPQVFVEDWEHRTTLYRL